MIVRNLIADDEIDFDSGFLMVPAAVPEVQGAQSSGVAPVDTGPVPSSNASREQVFKAFPAIANLTDKSDGGRIRIRIEASSAVGFEPSWLRDAVDEPFDEADIERSTEE